jgi:23S rRNA (guanosine2251-2'-O)-methyltransferase
LDNYIFGIHPLLEAIDTGNIPDKVLLQKGLQGDNFSLLFQKIRQKKIPFQMVPVEKLNRITRKNHQGVIAYISLIEYQPLPVLLQSIFEKGELPLLILLDGVTDVRNMGALVRTAECAGAHAVIIPEKGVAPVNADAIKASAGALSRLPICREPYIPGTISFLKECGLEVLALDDKGQKTIYETNFNKPLAVVMGSEDKGITPASLKLSDQVVSIPMKGRIGSLNVSVAAGVTLFEALRQREISQL